MSKKKKIIYTVLLGIMAICFMFLIIDHFLNIDYYVEYLKNHGIEYKLCFNANYAISRYGYDRAISCYINQNIVKLVIDIIILTISIIIAFLIWKIELEKVKYSYKDYKEEKLKKKELKKQKQREKLEQKLKNL